MPKAVLPSLSLSKLPAIDWRAVVSFGLPLALYLLTLAPTIYNLDSAEFTTAAATGGLVRATGYPLYLLLGRAWSWLPVGDVGYRMNLLSAFCGALTVFLAERILRRLGVGPWATIGALGLLAVAPYFWAMSLVAEVYTLHTALMAVLTLLLLRWAARPTLPRLALVGLAGGLSMGNHAATVLLIPGTVWYLLTVAPRKVLNPRALLVGISASLLGLAVYLYLPLQYGTAPAFNYAGQYANNGVFAPVNLRTAAGMWWLISGQAFSGEMFAYRGSALWREVGYFGAELWRAFFVVGIGPGLMGAVVLVRRDWRLGGMLLLMFAATAGFYINYNVVDKSTMFLPAYLVWALWLGCGYQFLLDWVRQSGGRAAGSWGRWLLRWAMVAMVVVAVAWTWRLVDRSSDWSTRERGETILHHVDRDAIILGWWDTAPAIEYLQLVEGQRPDVQTINRFLISDRALRLLVTREVAHRPVYIDEPPADLLRFVRAEKDGLLYLLKPRR